MIVLKLRLNQSELCISEPELACIICVCSSNTEFMSHIHLHVFICI